jgi:hypothetical protein
VKTPPRLNSAEKVVEEIRAIRRAIWREHGGDAMAIIHAYEAGKDLAKRKPRTKRKSAKRRRAR